MVRVLFSEILPSKHTVVWLSPPAGTDVHRAHPRDSLGRCGQRASGMEGSGHKGSWQVALVQRSDLQPLAPT